MHSRNSFPHSTTKEYLRQEIVSRCLVFSNSSQEIINPDGSISPWLMDFRRSFMDSTFLVYAANYFWDIFEDQYPFQVGGMESAAIPLIAAIGLIGEQRGRKINTFYIRKSRKRLGLLRQIEGALDSSKVILVDDLINGGGTFLKQVLLLEELGKNIHSLFAFIQFRPDAHYAYFLKKDIKIITPFTLKDFNLKSIEKNSNGSPFERGFSPIWENVFGEAAFHLVENREKVIFFEGKIIFSSDRGSIFCIDDSDGTLIWKTTLPSSRTAGRLFSIFPRKTDCIVLTESGRILTLDMSTGKILEDIWESDGYAPCSAWLPEKNMLLVPELIDVREKTYALSSFYLTSDTFSHRRGWSSTLPGKKVSAIHQVFESQIVIAMSHGEIISFESDTGKEIWRNKIPAHIAGKICSIGVDSIGIGATNGIYVLSTRTGDLQHWYETDGPIVSAPVYSSENKLVASCLDKYIYCFDMNTKRQLWKHATLGRIFADPVLINDTIIVGSNDGSLRALDLQKGHIIGLHQLPERITSGVTAGSDNFFYVRSIQNRIIKLQSIF